MVKPKRYRRSTEHERLKRLAVKCIVFTDRFGTVLDRGSTPFSAWLQMEYAVRHFHIFFRVTQSPYSDGHCYVEVKAGRTGRLVLKATGEYIASPVITKIHAYSKGAWEWRFRNGGPTE